MNKIVCGKFEKIDIETEIGEDGSINIVLRIQRPTVIFQSLTINGKRKIERLSESHQGKVKQGMYLPRQWSLH